MKTLKKMMGMLLVLVMFFTLSAVADAAEEPTYNWIFNATMKSSEMDTNPGGMAIQYFNEQVQERSNGQIKITMYTDGQLANSTDEVVTGALSDSFQLFNMPIGNLGGYTDAFRALDVPYLFLNSEQVYEMMDSGLGDSMKEEAIEDCGLRILTYLDLGFRQMTNSVRPIKTPDDLPGIKFRVMATDYQIALFENFGCGTVTTAYSELYSALQQGLVDGQDNPITNVYTGKLYETQKYLTLTNHNYTFTSISISDSAFQSLTPELQEMVLEVAREAELLCREKYAALEADYLEELSNSLEIYEPTTEELEAFKEKATGIWPMMEEAFGEEYWNYLMDLSAEVLGG